jgi:hypothetical protein
MPLERFRAIGLTGVQPRISPAGIEAGLKLQDCFLPPNSEVVLAIKKPPRHHS